MASSLAPLFRPRAVAVVGASDDPAKVGHALMRSLEGFPGPVLPVNPRAGTVGGRAAYPAVGDLPAGVDLAVLAVPAPAVPDVIEQCGAAGVGAAVVCAGGFAETGDAQRAALQQRVREAATEQGVRVLGPNTVGFVSPADGINATFVPEAGSIDAGPLAIVAQSGGMNLLLAFMAANGGLGLRLGVGLGNAADVGFADVLAFLADDDGAGVVALHVEGVADGRALVDAVRRVAIVKPVVALKVGRADLRDFAVSHTGNMIGSFDLTRAALTQAGAVVVDDPTELVDAARALTAARMPARADPGVALVTAQAGPGLVVADELRSRGVSIPAFTGATRARLADLLPPLTYQENPVDTARPGATLPAVVATVAADPSIDVVACFAIEEASAVDPTAVLRDVASSSVPVLFGTGGPAEAVGERSSQLAALGIPVFAAPERLARAVRALVADACGRHRLEHASPVATPGVGTEISGPMDEHDAKALLDDLGIATPARRMCAGRHDALAALAELGPPVVVKVLDPTLTHKTEAGGVVVGVRTEEALERALAAFDSAGFAGSAVLVEREAPPGPDLIVGALRDQAFGPTLVLGLGGTAAELAPPTAMRLLPLSGLDAIEMVRSLPAELREGFRGFAPVDEPELAEVLAGVGGVLASQPKIASIEINPLRIVRTGFLALDALVVTVGDERLDAAGSA
ncbi:MAG TPA: acetate--CoA ligase family protein [Acidimicrobiia bacterium]